MTQGGSDGSVQDQHQGDRERLLRRRDGAERQGCCPAAGRGPAEYSPLPGFYLVVAFREMDILDRPALPSVELGRHVHRACFHLRLYFLWACVLPIWRRRRAVSGSCARGTGDLMSLRAASGMPSRWV